MAKNKIEILTPTQYAEKRGVSLQSVTELIRKKRPLPAVTKVTKYGRFYVLDVDLDQLKKKEKK